MSSESLQEIEDWLLNSKISENDINKIIKKRRKEKVKAKGFNTTTTFTLLSLVLGLYIKKKMIA